MPITRPPDIIINRKTKEVTYNRRLSDEAKIEFLAPLLARFAIKENVKGDEVKCQNAQP